MLSVIMLNVVMLSAVMLSVVTPVVPTRHGSVVALDLQLPVVVAQQVPDLLVVDLDVRNVNLFKAEDLAGNPH
jgi:hypothetical protein